MEVKTRDAVAAGVMVVVLVALVVLLVVAAVKP
jgi:hypothetical protein